MSDEVYTEQDRLQDKYYEKKHFYMGEKFYEDVGFNASWGIDMPMSDMRYKLTTWYVPGDLRRYREEDPSKVEVIGLINVYKQKGVNYAETDVEKFTAQLKKVLIEDIRSTPDTESTLESNVSETKKDDMDRVVVLIYESESVWKKILGLKYSYFFIREETGLGFFSMAYNQEIIEGSLEELVEMIAKKKKVVSQFEVYVKWSWS